MRNQKKTRKKLIATVVVLLIATLVLTGCGGNEIKIGSKDFTENIMLGEIFAQLVENNMDVKVTRKLNLGGSFVCFEALKKGDIDVYAEYTGTGLSAMLEMDVINDADEAYRIVSEEFDQQFGITWLEPLGLNNTYAIAVSQEVYEKYGVETYSDLAKVSKDLVFGGGYEFHNRQDGFEGLVEH